MASVYKPVGGSGKESKYWHASFYVPGADGLAVLMRKTTKQRDRRLALEVAVQWERAGKTAGEGRLTQQKAREVLQGIMKNVGTEKLEEHTVEGWLRSWLAIKTAAGSEKTLVRYTHVVTSFLEWMGDRRSVPLEHLTSADLTGFQASQRKAGRAAVTVNLAVKTISQALQAAKKRGILTHSPAEPLENIRDRESSGRMPFTQAEVVKLLDNAEGEWRGAVLLGLYSGARLGDVTTMRWQHVDLSTGLICFTPQKTSLTSQRKITIPIMPPLEAWLLTQAIPEDAKSAVFPALSKLKVGGYNGLSRQFKKLMERAGVEAGVSRERTGTAGRAVSQKSFHSLRHTLNSWLHNAGVAVELRQRLLGHSTPAMNNHYSHTEQATLRTAMDTVPMLGLAETLPAES
jgi:integrase